MSLTIIALAALAVLVVAGLYKTAVGIPAAVRGVPRMHIYAPPTAMFIAVASALAIIAPHNGMTPATTQSVMLSLGLAMIFGTIGFVTLLNRGLVMIRK